MATVEGSRFSRQSHQKLMDLDFEIAVGEDCAENEPRRKVFEWLEDSLFIAEETGIIQICHFGSQRQLMLSHLLILINVLAQFVEICPEQGKIIRSGFGYFEGF